MIYINHMKDINDMNYISDIDYMRAKQFYN